MIGRLVGDCLLISVLGAGGFGKVFLALQRPIGMKVAVKLLHAQEGDAALAEVMLAKFEGEAQALASLDHPNIVQLKKYGRHEGAPYLVMQFVDGGQTLQEMVRRNRAQGEALSVDAVQCILRQVVDGLGAAHRLSIVHRDVKPENVMIQRLEGHEHFVRLLDFGLAKFIEEHSRNSVAMGTPAYMAPEQVAGGRIGPWTDLYAVGVVAFELMTGRRPFSGRTHREILSKKLDPTFDVAAAVADLAVPTPLLSFFRRALARDGEVRPQSAEAFRAGLDAALEAAQGNAREATLGATAKLDPTPEADVAAQRRRVQEAQARLAEEERRIKRDAATLYAERAQLVAEKAAARKELDAERLERAASRPRGERDYARWRALESGGRQATEGVAVRRRSCRSAGDRDRLIMGS